MSELLQVKQAKSVVDATWYLATYPDVAAAGADPQQHYEEHGCAEGRFPRPLQAHRLETALWGGFTRQALPELRLWWEHTEDTEERAYASWALARWYASACDWPNALPYIAGLSDELPPYIGSLGPTLLSVEVLLRNDRQALAEACITKAMVSNGIKADLCLAAANACMATGLEQHHSPATRRLAWLNGALAIAELAPISLRDPNVGLSLDNLQANHKPGATPKAQPKISVIMPAYNAEAFIETALRSLLAQSWKNLEILVVDDRSSDSTVERVSAMARQDARIILLQQPENRGAYAARNTALQHATGSLLVNHDSDDWSHPQRLELMATPLLQDTRLVGTLADWVRADTQLHFQSWRIADSLIEPSVSTIMVRCEAVRQLGGWDEVRVAADHELRQRLLRRHGAEAILHVQPGVPLVIARQLPGSLTMATGTHLRSTFFGLRQLYSALSDTWHGMTENSLGLRLPAVSSRRAFPAPAPMLRNAPAVASYDWLLISDLSEGSRTAKALQAVLKRLMKSDQRIALLHWPDYHRPAPISQTILQHAVRTEVDIVLAEQRLEAGRVLIIGRHLLAHPLDHVPHLLSLPDCQVIDSIRDVRSLPAVVERLEEPLPSLFNPDWYLQRYPDVRAAGVDPWQHYQASGAAEGRDPGPDFNTAWYLEQCPEARDSDLPVLLHYLNVGRELGYEAGHPTLTGGQAYRPGRPTVLLCAHAADEQLFGAERCLPDVLDACAKLELNVLVSVPSVANAAYMAELQARALLVACIPTLPWRADAAPCPVAVERFAELIKAHSVDLVQANTIMLREPLIAARQADVPAIMHVHESPAHDAELCEGIGLPPAQVVAQALERADHVLANSGFTAQHLAKPGATHVVGNIIDFKAFDLPNTINSKCITAALISSNLPKKGVQDLLELARELAADTPNLQLLLIGPESPSVAGLRELHARGALPDNLRLMPYASSPQAAIAQANIVLNLSHCQETFGRTLLEGMAASRPVLAYRWGALPELIEEGVNGFTFQQGDIHAMADKLRHFCRAPKKMRTLGTAGRKRAKQYDLKRLCQQLDRAYSTILGHSLQEPHIERQHLIEEMP
ncbi:glycosyltransferase [Pseudomonas putida]